MSLARLLPDCLVRVQIARAVAPWRTWLVWWLIATLCVYSASASVLRVMGPRHSHAVAVDLHRPAPASALSTITWLGPLGAQVRQRISQQVVPWLAGVQRLADAAHARAHALGAVPHHHSHSALQRHWHSADDDTVRLAADAAIDPDLADLSANAAIGGAMLLPMLSHHGAWQLCAQANGRWPLAGAQDWRSVLATPPLDPPIA